MSASKISHNIHELFQQMTTEYEDDLKQRYYDKVDTAGDCWTWTGATSSDYGNIGIQLNGETKMLKAHRLGLYLDQRKDISDKHVLHSCHNKDCVNPTHLYLGTESDNTIDAVRNGTHYAHGRLPPTEEVKQIRRKWENSDKKQAEIADEHGITQSGVSKIVNNHRRNEVY